MIITEILKLLEISQIEIKVKQNPTKLFTIDQVRNRARKLPYIDFPKSEYLDIQKRFEVGKLVYTHRMYEEALRWTEDIVYVRSPFGLLQIVENKELKDLYEDNQFKGDPEFEQYKFQLKGLLTVRHNIS